MLQIFQLKTHLQVITGKAIPKVVKTLNAIIKELQLVPMFMEKKYYHYKPEFFNKTQALNTFTVKSCAIEKAGESPECRMSISKCKLSEVLSNVLPWTRNTIEKNFRRNLAF